MNIANTDACRKTSLGKPVNYSIRSTTNISKPLYDLVSDSINPSQLVLAYDSIWGPIRELVRIATNRLI